MYQWINIRKSTNVTHHIDDLIEKNNIVLIDMEKTLDKGQHLFSAALHQEYKTSIKLKIKNFRYKKGQL